MQEPKIRMF